MGTNFNFKSQICTSADQSRRLLELGLKRETADIVYYFSQSLAQDWTIIPLANGETARCIEGLEIPAWSLHRLIEMMPRCLIEDRVYHEYWDLNVTPCAVIYRNQDEQNDWIGECLGQGMYNNIIDCIEWLIKEGYFNKEYLV